jgi:hypothetical protein
MPAEGERPRRRIVSYSCPDPTCEYRTPRSKNLERHIEKTGHGQTRPAKESRVHLAPQRSRKDRDKRKRATN